MEPLPAAQAKQPKHNTTKTNRNNNTQTKKRAAHLGVQHLHWVRAAWNREDGAAEEVAGKLLGVQRGRSDDDLQVFALLDDRLRAASEREGQRGVHLAQPWLAMKHRRRLLFGRGSHRLRQAAPP